MNLKLVRNNYTTSGVFGILLDDQGQQIAVTLEHNYTQGTTVTAKVRHGVYQCLRHAPNRLPYETFELQNVPDFQGTPVTGILIHCGNFDSDSSGCCLLGEKVAPDTSSANPKALMVTNSKVTFAKFMELQNGLNEFTLTIE